jgi:hypothetical protein
MSLSKGALVLVPPQAVSEIASAPSAAPMLSAFTALTSYLLSSGGWWCRP